MEQKDVESKYTKLDIGRRYKFLNVYLYIYIFYIMMDYIFLYRKYDILWIWEYVFLETLSFYKDLNKKFKKIIGGSRTVQVKRNLSAMF